MAANGPLEEKTATEVTTKGLSLSDLVEEIKRQGISVRKHLASDGENVYVGLSMPAPKS